MIFFVYKSLIGIIQYKPLNKLQNVAVIYINIEIHIDLYIYFYQYSLYRGWSYIGTGNRAECTTIFQLFRGGKFVIGGRNRSSLESDSNRLIYISLVLD